MAIFDKQNKNGIQLGKYLDKCEMCTKPNQRFEYGELEYKETFKLNIAGLEYSLCMDHFKELLGDYVLVHKDELEAAVKEQSETLVEDNEAPKKTTKKSGK